MAGRKSISRSTDPLASDMDADKGARARQALVKAGLHIFGDNSYESASTREIARMAKANSAAVSYYFGGKQGLYMAVMEYVVQAIAQRVTPLLDSASEFLDAGRLTPNDCLKHLSRLLESSTMHATSDDELIALSSIIVREQTQPTEAFEVLYNGILRRFHLVGEKLMAAYVCGDPTAADDFHVRFHALLGQALAFRVARATVLRAAGWSSIGVSQEAEIREVVLEHTVHVLNGLRVAHRRNERAA